MCSKSKSFKEQELRECFDEIDTDKSGSIDKSELASALEKLGVSPGAEMDELLELFMSADDANNDGKLSWNEFKNGLLAEST